MHAPRTPIQEAWNTLRGLFLLAACAVMPAAGTLLVAHFFGATQDPIGLVITAVAMSGNFLLGAILAIIRP
jgi:hypothetical protein